MNETANVTLVSSISRYTGPQLDLTKEQLQNMLVLKGDLLSENSIAQALILSLGMEYDVALVSTRNEPGHWIYDMAVDCEEVQAVAIPGNEIATGECYVPLLSFDTLTVELTMPDGTKRRYPIKNHIGVPNNDGDSLMAPDFDGAIWMVAGSTETPEALVHDFTSGFDRYSDALQEDFAREFEAVMQVMNGTADLANTASAAIARDGGVSAKATGDMALIHAVSNTTFDVKMIDSAFLESMAKSLNTDCESIRAAFAAAIA